MPGRVGRTSIQIASAMAQRPDLPREPAVGPLGSPRKQPVRGPAGWLGGAIKCRGQKFSDQLLSNLVVSDRGWHGRHCRDSDHEVWAHCLEDDRGPRRTGPFNVVAEHLRPYAIPSFG